MVNKQGRRVQSPNRPAAQSQKSRNFGVEGVRTTNRRPKTSKSKQVSGAAVRGRNHFGAQTALGAKELSSSGILHQVKAQQSSSPTRDDRSKKTEKGSVGKSSKKKGQPVGS